MALQKRVTNAVLVAGVHTLTLSDVDGLEVGYPIRVAGVSLDNYDGRHVIAGVDTTAKTIYWTQGNQNLAAAEVTGIVDVEVLWADVDDVLGYLGVEPANQLDEDYLEVSVQAGNEWCYDRRRISGYDDLPNAVPNPSAKLATVLMSASLYRERGSVESFQSFAEFPTNVPIGGGLGQIQRLLGVNKPRIA
jgi:hypothetical protein